MADDQPSSEVTEVPELTEIPGEDESKLDGTFIDPSSCPDEILSLLSSGMLTGLDNDVLRAILSAKRGDPNKFLSLWEDDDEGVENLSLEEIQSDPAKKILWAAENNMLETVEEMLNESADLIESRDSDMYTALHRASYNDHLDMVKLLISRGADIEAQTSDGWRPLHSACRWSNTTVASLLLQSGAEVNAQTHGGQTALHLAAANQDSRETLQLLLLDETIQPNLKNSIGETAKDICRRTSELCKLFEMTEDCVNNLY
ncbi:ankyrin repeat domain-containing protein 49-like [Liolophura sinensis]|uniref:ankyrin repeat domain-containing protein 49-like n=1 Tax=Liolophura sinensis TaxID=3198878 RepID=UPI0031594CE1